MEHNWIILSKIGKSFLEYTTNFPNFTKPSSTLWKCEAKIVYNQTKKQKKNPKETMICETKCNDFTWFNASYKLS